METFVPFVRGIHRSPVNSLHKGEWRGALIFSLICAWINGWVNNREAGELRRHRTHYDVTVMLHDYVTGNEAVQRLPQCQRCNPKEYGQINHVVLKMNYAVTKIKQTNSCPYFKGYISYTYLHTVDKFCVSKNFDTFSRTSIRELKIECCCMRTIDISSDNFTINIYICMYMPYIYIYILWLPIISRFHVRICFALFWLFE